MPEARAATHLGDSARAVFVEQFESRPQLRLLCGINVLGLRPRHAWAAILIELLHLLDLLCLRLKSVQHFQ